MLARDPFLDFLIGNAWLDRLLLMGIARRALTSSIVIAGAHSAVRPELIRLSVPTQGFPRLAQT
jgi:hypothetical protein